MENVTVCVYCGNAVDLDENNVCPFCGATLEK